MDDFEHLHFLVPVINFLIDYLHCLFCKCNTNYMHIRALYSKRLSWINRESASLPVSIRMCLFSCIWSFGNDLHSAVSCIGRLHLKSFTSVLCSHITYTERFNISGGLSMYRNLTTKPVITKMQFNWEFCAFDCLQQQQKYVLAYLASRVGNWN